MYVLTVRYATNSADYSFHDKLFAFMAMNTLRNNSPRVRFTLKRVPA